MEQKIYEEIISLRNLILAYKKTRKGKTFFGCKNWPVCKFASWTKPKVGDSGQVTGDSKK